MTQKTWEIVGDRSAPDRPYAELCATLARHYECSEFDLFERAYLDWYGKPTAEREIERLFVRFIFYHETPFWMRQYLQRIGPTAPALHGARLRTSHFSRCCVWLLQILCSWYWVEATVSGSDLVA